MSQLVGLSQIENNMNESSISHIHLSFDQDLFSNYLEPNQNDIFDTRRFSLQPRNSQVLNTATPKGLRSSTPNGNRSKMTSRINSERVIPKSTFRSSSQKTSSQSKLVKKVENLEKKQELWKERANVWDKERRTYKKALENVNPANFYKSQLEHWKAKSYLKKVSEDLANNPLQELKNIFEWICSQPDSVPFKSIKLSFAAITSKITQIEEMFEEYQRSQSLLDLSQQNDKLNKQLVEIEAKLKRKVKNLVKFEEQMKEMQGILAEKEEEIKKLGEKNEGSRFGDIKSLDFDVLVKIEAELEEKNYEVIMIKTENSRLVNDLAQSNKSNEIYIKTIDELKEKLKNARQESTLKSTRDKESLSTMSKTARMSESSTQTYHLRNPKKRNEKRGPGYQDFISFTSCMATAIEELIER